jgi:hypothetical protein
MTNGGSSPEERDAYLKSEIAKWSKVINDANVQPMDYPIPFGGILAARRLRASISPSPACLG